MLPTAAVRPAFPDLWAVREKRHPAPRAALAPLEYANDATPAGALAKAEEVVVAELPDPAFAAVEGPAWGDALVAAFAAVGGPTPTRFDAADDDGNYLLPDRPLTVAPGDGAYGTLPSPALARFGDAVRDASLPVPRFGDPAAGTASADGPQARQIGKVSLHAYARTQTLGEVYRPVRARTGFARVVLVLHPGLEALL